jgi:hypothetical protein
MAKTSAAVTKRRFARERGLGRERGRSRTPERPDEEGAWSFMR